MTCYLARPATTRDDGDDLLAGGDASDLLYGGRGADVLIGTGPSADYLDAGDDDDVDVLYARDGDWPRMGSDDEERDPGSGTLVTSPRPPVDEV
jgi:Ca2+-binding RTX toxin-like protein